MAFAIECWHCRLVRKTKNNRKTLIFYPMKTFILLFAGLLLTAGLYAQEFDTSEFKTPQKEQTATSENTTSTANTEAQVRQLLPLSSWEFYLSLIVLGFGTLVLAFEVVLIWKRKIKEDNTVKFIIVTLIITATLFLITAGYDNNQIAPAMGLLGTIAGYLLGKQEKEEKQENEVKNKKQAPDEPPKTNDNEKK